MGTVVQTGELRLASTRKYCHKGPFVDWTFLNNQAAMHLGARSAIIEGPTAASAETGKRAHYARPGTVFFGRHSFKLITLPVEGFERFSECAEELIGQVAVLRLRVWTEDESRGETW